MFKIWKKLFSEKKWLVATSTNPPKVRSKTLFLGVRGYQEEVVVSFWGMVFFRILNFKFPLYLRKFPLNTCNPSEMKNFQISWFWEINALSQISIGHYWSEIRSVVRSVVDTPDQWSDQWLTPSGQVRSVVDTTDLDSGQVRSGVMTTDLSSGQVRSGVMTTDLSSGQVRSGVMTTDLSQVGCHDHWSDLTWTQIGGVDHWSDLTWTKISSVNHWSDHWSRVSTTDLNTGLGCRHLMWPLILISDRYWCQTHPYQHGPRRSPEVH